MSRGFSLGLGLVYIKCKLFPQSSSPFRRLLGIYTYPPLVIGGSEGCGLPAWPGCRFNVLQVATFLPECTFLKSDKGSGGLLGLFLQQIIFAAIQFMFHPSPLDFCRIASIQRSYFFQTPIVQKALYVISHILMSYALQATTSSSSLNLSDYFLMPSAGCIVAALCFGCIYCILCIYLETVSWFSS